MSIRPQVYPRVKFSFRLGQTSEFDPLDPTVGVPPVSVDGTPPAALRCVIHINYPLPLLKFPASNITNL